MFLLVVGLGIYFLAGTKKPPEPAGSPEVAANPSNPVRGTLGKKDTTATDPKVETPKKEDSKPHEPAGSPEVAANPSNPVRGTLGKKDTTATDPKVETPKKEDSKPHAKPKTPLPGAKGERFVFTGTPTNPWAVYLSEATELPKGGPKAPWKQVLPSGTKFLQLGVVFTGEPAVDSSARVFNDAGEVQLDDVGREWIMLGSTYIRQLHLRPKSGVFPDGAYQAEVYHKGAKVAVLNWSIGGE